MSEFVCIFVWGHMCLWKVGALFRNHFEILRLTWLRVFVTWELRVDLACGWFYPCLVNPKWWTFFCMLYHDIPKALNQNILQKYLLLDVIESAFQQRLHFMVHLQNGGCLNWRTLCPHGRYSFYGISKGSRKSRGGTYNHTIRFCTLGANSFSILPFSLL